MKVGDLIVAKYDVERHIHCVGVVTDINNDKYLNVKVHWIAKHPKHLTNGGWWREEKLKKFE